MERQVVTVPTFQAEKCDAQWPSDNLLAFKDWLEGQIASIPSDALANATIEIKTAAFYEGADPDITISYTRFETDHEMQLRYQQELHIRTRREAERATMIKKLLDSDPQLREAIKKGEL